MTTSPLETGVEGGRSAGLAMGHVAVVGGGPAGLMAAEVLSAAGVPVVVYDAMPSFGRKLLMAGRGGLNLTHSEPLDALLGRYGDGHRDLALKIRAFPPEALIAFVEALGVPTFVGSSGRVFPRMMKASPMLRAWLRRLGQRGVAFKARHRLVAIDRDGHLQFETPAGRLMACQAAVVLALGGASWPRLGSDGRWCDLVAGLGGTIVPLVASNVGVAVDWSEPMARRFAGEPLKRIALSFGDVRVRGEAVVTMRGLEGGAIYALVPHLRAALARGPVRVLVDLRPDMAAGAIIERLARPRGKLSTQEWLRKSLQLSPVCIGLLREAGKGAVTREAEPLAGLIKAVPVTIAGLGPIDRAISSAGGVAFSSLDDAMMLKARPGVFVAGEMADWDAPTGGYLLQAAMATGHAAGRGVIRYLGEPGI